MGHEHSPGWLDGERHRKDDDTMHQLTFELRNLADRNRDGSYATRANRTNMLKLMGDQLWEAGYKKMHAGDLKGRHVNALLHRWQADGLSPGTIKNRLSVLRWWAEKIGRASVLAPRNAHYAIPPRETVARVSKAKDLPPDVLARIQDRYVRMSLELQRAFGLRREEAMKIKPRQADHGAMLTLRGSWTKGGRPRDVPIRTTAQREVLDRATALAKGGALIPPDCTYVRQMRRYERECSRVGLRKMHGLRHLYAQDRFLELTGFAAPAAGGPTQHELTPAQREADADARMIISEELGHGREAITTAYLGR